MNGLMFFTLVCLIVAMLIRFNEIHHTLESIDGKLSRRVYGKKKKE